MTSNPVNGDTSVPSATQVEAAARMLRRRAVVPDLRYPSALPIVQAREELLTAIRDHQVVIVAGETGSGKTTQLPKMCLELGRGIQGLIGHTQPRRIAARSVAERIAEELQTPLGDLVGYQVRFTDQTSTHGLIKVMTDGILLAEIQRDRDLRAYDTLIIDEAHERSLNIDFILGYLKQLLPRRPDLKVVITSATIDPERFSRHFDGAPVVEVSGRMYPVEVRYRPLVDDERDGQPTRVERDQVQAVAEAVAELCAEGPGDILVFLSGEREIRDTADGLQASGLRDTEILPLYARLSAAEQHRVFQAHEVRRIVLATNVAETSLTVPGIRYVVDPGTARISRYSHRLKVQRLPIEPISQASANQRRGRCGRVAEGICIRLYSQADFASRPEFTDPEILRTNLASVILQMTALGLGDIAAFPFVEAPDRRQVKDGVALLEELGALDPAAAAPSKRLTPLGRQLAQLPLDPRMARMVLEADRNGCVREVLVIAAALSIQDPRERPIDSQQAADEMHRRFADETSDFLGYLNLWNYLRSQQKALSSNQFRRLCRAEFLHYLRVREWQDLYSQLRQVVKGLHIDLNDTPAEPDRVHRSILAGLLSHIGMWDVEKRQYLGARNARFAIFPGSSLARKPPRWAMAAELVETARLWAREVARIEPEWAEECAQHLVKRSYSEPHWDSKRGAVMAYERVTLYGVPLVAGRKVGYARVDPALSRELFIRHALVEGDWQTGHEFFHRNRELLREVDELEHRARRRDLRVDDEALFAFYDDRVGADVVSARHFDSWWKKVRRKQPGLLTMTVATVTNDDARQGSEQHHPDVWLHGDLRLPLSYQFEPGSEADGVTAHIPVAVLNRVEALGFEWQVPGLREELVIALIKSLPKQLRRNLVPATDHAHAVLACLEARAGERPLLEALGDELSRRTGTQIPREAWDWARVPAYLRITFRVEDEQGRSIAAGKDLDELKRRLHRPVRAVIAQAADSIEASGLLEWSCGTLPRTFERAGGAHAIRGYPALVDEGGSVGIRVLASEEEQQREMWLGNRRLLLLTLPSPVKPVVAQLSNRSKLALGHNPHASVSGLLADCAAAAVDRLMREGGGPAWDREAFETLRARVREALNPSVLEIVLTVERILTAAYDLELRLRDDGVPAQVPARADMRAQLARLIHPGFVTGAGAQRLPDLLRYLQAMHRRLERLPRDPLGDRERMTRVKELEQSLEHRLQRLAPQGAGDRARRRALAEVRWMLEELRVSLFAQQLRTPYPVSEQRIRRAMEAVD